MSALLAADHLEFLAGFRAYLDGLDPELVAATRQENIEDPMQPRVDGRRFLRQLGGDGWLGVAWPREVGGRGLTPLHHWLFAEELYDRRLPNGLSSLNVVGPTIALLGDERQRARYLNGVLRGEVGFAIGYSEPDAGSDLASLRTRAVADGPDYVVNGQKTWTTGATEATHLWLAVRTGEQSARHRGITVLITPLDAPGITIRPIRTQGGERTNAVFFDDVRIPATERIGAEDDGWTAVTAALNFERMFYHNEPRWELRQLCGWAAEEELLDGAGAESARVLETVGELAVDVEICRLFAMRGAAMLTAGTVPVAEASVNKIWWGELRQRICDTGLDLVGEPGTVAFGDAAAPAGGHLERGLRSSPVWRFGGGANELQLDIIATRRLGMPR